MNFMLPVAFCLSFSLLFLALIIHFRNPYDNFYKLSSLALAILFAAIFYNCMAIFALGYAEAGALSKLADSFWLLAAALIFHAVLYYQDNPFLNSRFGQILIYAPPLLTLAGLFTNHSFYSGFTNTSRGLIPSPNDYYFLFLSIECLYLLLSAAICFSINLKSSDNFRKRQAGLLALALIIALAGTGANYFSLFSRQLFPQINISAWMIAFLVAILVSARYQLFPRYPEIMGETIFNYLPDSLLVTDLQGKISLTNKVFYDLAELDQRNEVLLRSLGEVMQDKAAANFLTHYIIRQNRIISDCPLAIKKHTLSLNAAQIRDNTGDKIGMVMIGRDVTERKKNEAELKARTETLEKNLKEIDYLNHLFVEREIEMSKLKEEISALGGKPANG